MEVKLRIGAQVDSSLRTAFRPLVASALDARRQILQAFAGVPKEITAAFAGLGRAQGGQFRAATAEARAAYKTQADAAREAAKIEISAAKEARRQETALAKASAQEIRREHQQIAREEQQQARASIALDRQRSTALYAQHEAQARETERFARRTSYRTTRIMAPLVGFAARAGAEVARGYGIDPSVAGAFERNVELEAASTRQSNKARLAGQNVSSEDIQSRVREVSNKYGLKRSQASEALDAFVDKSGDLKMGLDVLDKVAERSIVMSSDMKDLASTMGATSNQLGDTKDKTQKLFNTLDSFGVQADRGYTSMANLAKQTPKLVPLAQMFGGDREKNFAELGTMVQLALIGGSGTAPQAATAVKSFATVFSTPARLKAIRSLGILGKDEKATDVDPLELIRRSVIATKGDTEQLFGTVFKNVNSQAVIRATANAYNSAGGGQKGEAAMLALSDKFMKGTKISDSEAQQALDARNETTTARVQRFQNALDDTAKKVQSSLLPALEKLAPIAIQVADVFGSIAKVAVENPGKAVVAAIVGSIGRAGLESGLRGVLEKLIVASIGGVGGRGAGGGPGFMGMPGIAGVAGAASIGLAIGVPIAAGIYAAGISDVNDNLKDVDASARETAWFRKKAEDPHGASPAEKEKAHRDILDREEQLKDLKANRFGGWQGALDSLTYFGHGIGAPSDFFGRDERIRQIEGDLKEKRHAMETMDATKYIAPDEVSRWVAKDPSKTSRADLVAAQKRGGAAELEKIATLQTKQQTAADQLVKQGVTTNELLGKLVENTTPKGGNAPDVDNQNPNGKE